MKKKKYIIISVTIVSGVILLIGFALNLNSFVTTFTNEANEIVEIERELSVDLPIARSTSIPDAENYIILKILPEGTFLDEIKTKIDDLPKKLKEAMTSEKRGLLILTDESIDYNIVLKVIDKAKEAEIYDIAFTTLNNK